VRKSFIWYNKFVKVNRRPVFNSRAYHAGIKIISDIVDLRGRFLTYAAFTEKYPTIQINPLTFMGWCQAVPRRWRTALLDGAGPVSDQEKNACFCVTCKGKEIAVTNITCRLLYFLAFKNIIPTAQLRWIGEGIDFGDKWAAIYNLPFKITPSTKLQTLQYKITHIFFSDEKVFVYSAGN